MTSEDEAPPRVPRPLDAVELRILGSLLEKQQATPEAYPLTVHGLVAACNQKTNREPVMELSEREVVDALERLREHVLVWHIGGARSDKWEENVVRRWTLDARDKAVMTLLLLRGAQTPGELRSRSDRLHSFATLEVVEQTLAVLAAGPDPLVVELSRRPGQKEARWMHLAGGPVSDATTSAATPVPREPVGEPLSARVARLEERVAELEKTLADLRHR